MLGAPDESETDRFAEAFRCRAFLPARELGAHPARVRDGLVGKPGYGDMR